MDNKYDHYLFSIRLVVQEVLGVKHGKGQRSSKKEFNCLCACMSILV